MVNNKIETIEDLDNFAKNNYEEYSNLMGKEKIFGKDIIEQKLKIKNQKYLLK